MRQTRSPMLSPPRYGTRRRADRPTSGAQAAVIAELLGVRLQPWQRYALDVAGELIPDEETGELIHAYQTVSVSVGRRAGKSLLALTRLLREVTAGGRRFSYYAAQNGKAGAERFRNDWIPTVNSAAPILSRRLTSRLTNGTETLTDRNAGAYLRIFAPIPTALHGDAADVVMFDECWSHSLERGRDLEVAAFPLMATRPGAQLWQLSAAGDVDSAWWAEILEAGRAAAAADLGAGRCHLEWTADGIDPARWADEEVWIDAHPGIAHPGNPAGVIRLGFLRAEHDRDPGQFARSYLNVTDRTGTTSAPIDLEAWQALAGEAPDRSGLLTLGIDVAPDQTSAAIVACAVVAGVPVLELIDHRPGYLWVPGRCAELYDRYQLHALALDAGGQSPAVVLRRPLEALGLPLELLDLAGAAAAAADLVSAVRAGAVLNVPDPRLDAAAAAGRRRPVGDGSWLWRRLEADTAGDAPPVDVSPLIAATFARWSHPEVIAAAAGAIS